MTVKLDILLLQPDFSRYKGAYYQHPFIQALGRVEEKLRFVQDNRSSSRIVRALLGEPAEEFTGAPLR